MKSSVFFLSTKTPNVINIYLQLLRILLATTKRVRRDRTAAGTSKQSGGSAATDRCTNRKQSISTTRPHHSSIRRGSQFHEVHIAMLPDLSGKKIKSLTFLCVCIVYMAIFDRKTFFSSSFTTIKMSHNVLIFYFSFILFILCIKNRKSHR